MPRDVNLFRPAVERLEPRDTPSALPADTPPVIDPVPARPLDAVSDGIDPVVKLPDGLAAGDLVSVPPVVGGPDGVGAVFDPADVSEPRGPEDNGGEFRDLLATGPVGFNPVGPPAGGEPFVQSVPVDIPPPVIDWVFQPSVPLPPPPPLLPGPREAPGSLAGTLDDLVVRLRAAAGGEVPGMARGHIGPEGFDPARMLVQELRALRPDEWRAVDAVWARIVPADPGVPRDLQSLLGTLGRVGPAGSVTVGDGVFSLTERAAMHRLIFELKGSPVVVRVLMEVVGPIEQMYRGLVIPFVLMSRLDGAPGPGEVPPAVDPALAVGPPTPTGPAVIAVPDVYVGPPQAPGVVAPSPPVAAPNGHAEYDLPPVRPTARPGAADAADGPAEESSSEATEVVEEEPPLLAAVRQASELLAVVTPLPPAVLEQAVVRLVHRLEGALTGTSDRDEDEAFADVETALLAAAALLARHGLTRRHRRRA
jgi:hypothetical protein